MSGTGPNKLSALTRSDSEAMARRRRGRNIALLIVLLFVAALFYAIAMVKLGGAGMP